MALRADHKVIKDETLNILLAGRDTTSCTLTFAVYALAAHAPVLARLRAEVLRVVGPARRPTYADVREMKYMRAFVNEVLRLYPPVPVNSRCSIGPMTWKNVDGGRPDWYVPPRSRDIESTAVHVATDNHPEQSIGVGIARDGITQDAAGALSRLCSRAGGQAM